jgi:hypothetical protein
MLKLEHIGFSPELNHLSSSCTLWMNFVSVFYMLCNDTFLNYYSRVVNGEN